MTHPHPQGAHPRDEIGHNGRVTSPSITYSATAPVVNRPNSVAVGTIVWLGSEVMFFAGLFAIYFLIAPLTDLVT